MGGTMLPGETMTWTVTTEHSGEYVIQLVDGRWHACMIPDDIIQCRDLGAYDTAAEAKAACEKHATDIDNH